MGKISNISGESEPYQHIRITTAPWWDKRLEMAVKNFNQGR
jgi:hypothetical protein